ncbi:Auxin response factor 11 [Spatholobus suberectus]|nr:Auxin response factor 11 [Spatholobus suberectus]
MSPCSGVSAHGTLRRESCLVLSVCKFCGSLEESKILELVWSEYFTKMANVDYMVQWDGPGTIPRPGRVSCWEIEPFVASTLNATQSAVKGKRSRPADVSSSGWRLVHVPGSPATW